MLRIVLALSLVFLITACATSPGGRAQLVPPAPLQGFSAVYSEFDMHFKLVTAADAPSCRESECIADRAFDQRIVALGRRLAEAAFSQHADLNQRFPRFEFIVADKTDAGSASSAGGTVVIYRGVRQMDFDDAALAFVMAREMGHVIGGHHDENATTSILVALAVQIVFPMLNVARGATAIVSGGAATNAVGSTAMASAASFAGSRALRDSYRPTHDREAETLALELLAAAGWEGREVSDQLEALPPPADEEPSWTKELRESGQRIAGLMQGPLLADAQTPGGVARQVSYDLPVSPLSPYDLPASPLADYDLPASPLSAYDLPPPLVSQPY